MQRRPTVGPGSQKAPFRERLPGTISKLGKGTALQRWQTWGAEGASVDLRGGGGGRLLVLVFFINPIGASELTRGVSSSNLGTNPSTTPFFERGHRLNSSRWLYRTPPTLVGRLQLTPA